MLVRRELSAFNKNLLAWTLIRVLLVVFCIVHKLCWVWRVGVSCWKIAPRSGRPFPAAFRPITAALCPDGRGSAPPVSFSHVTRREGASRVWSCVIHMRRKSHPCSRKSLPWNPEATCTRSAGCHGRHGGGQRGALQEQVSGAGAGLCGCKVRLRERPSCAVFVLTISPRVSLFFFPLSVMLCRGESSRSIKEGECR